MNDPYGVEIEVGSRVAYNYQGEVRLGDVIEFKESRRYYMDTPYILIRESVSGKTSRVSRPVNLVVLTGVENSGVRVRVRV